MGVGCGIRDQPLEFYSSIEGSRTIYNCVPVINVVVLVIIRTN